MHLALSVTSGLPVGVFGEQGANGGGSNNNTKHHERVEGETTGATNAQKAARTTTTSVGNGTAGGWREVRVGYKLMR